jgi:hypothetical protein
VVIRRSVLTCGCINLMGEAVRAAMVGMSTTTSQKAVAKIILSVIG